MTRTVLVAGTASHVGKSTVAAGLCRHLADRGVDVAPFKAQNMSNNARVAPSVGATDAAYGEIGVAQHTQARAARTPATTDHNPVLLKPRGGGESELVVDGVAVADCSAGAYYDRHWRAAHRAARRAHDRLRADHDLVVAEGAGSIGEVNLHDRDLANVETARFGDAAVVLVTDIDRGGAFGSLVGTLELLPDDVHERVGGAVITKFRGDRSLLAPGIETVQERTGVPVLGVLPHNDPGLPAEDSLSLPAADEGGVWDGGTASERGRHVGDSSTATSGGTTDDGRPLVVGALRLPRVSNATDLAPLAEEPGVVVRWVPPGESLAGCDAVVVPGSKNTVADARALADAGAFEALRRFDGPIVGLCGGYQLLGERLTDAGVEGLGDATTIPAAGLLPVETEFEPTKTVRPVERSTTGAGPLDGVEATVRGYEIHAGSTSLLDDVARPFPGAGATTGRVLGTYVHDLFATRAVRRGFLHATARAAGRALHIDHDPAVHDPADQTAAGHTPAGHTPAGHTPADPAPADPCDAAAALVADHVDLGPLAEAVAVDLQPGAGSDSRS